MGDDAGRAAVAVADHGLLLLAFWRDHRELRPPAHLYARKLQRKACRASSRDEPGMTVASWQQRPESRGYCPRPLLRSISRRRSSRTNYLVEEPRSPRRGRRHEAGAPAGSPSAPLAPYYAYEDFPGPNVQSDDEILHAVTQRGHYHLPSRLAPAGWDPPTRLGPWSTISCACTGCRACAWSMPRSCRA